MKLNKITQLMLLALYAGLLAPMNVSANDDEDDEDEYDNPWTTIQQVEYTNHLELGTYYSTDDSLRMGQFNGADSQGIREVLNLDLRNLAVNDKEQATFWKLTLDDVGLDTSYLDAQFGVQGSYKAQLTYKEVVSHELFMNQATSLYSAGWGTNNLGVPSDEFAEVNSRLKRRQVKLGVEWDFMPNWLLSANVKQEDKKGSKTRSAYRGGPGGSPPFLAEPVDARSTKFGLELAYAERHYQASLGYTNSTWRNQYQYFDYLGFNRGNPVDQRIGVDPDNDFEQLKLNLAWMLSDKTRFYLYGGFGRATQDDSYLISSLGNTDLTLPQDSLDGEVEYSDLKLSVNHRFTSKLVMNVSYKNTDRDNKTAKNIYEYASLDGAGCFVVYRGISCLEQNMPLSWSSDKYSLDLSYRLNSSWSMIAGASFEDKQRTSQIAELSDEKKYWTKVKFRPGSKINLDLKYTYADRQADSYVVTNYIRFDGSEDTRVADVALRQSHKGDRKLNRTQFNVRYTPVMEWSFGLGGDVKREDYADGKRYQGSASDLLGLKSMDVNTYRADITYQPSQHLNMTLFYSFSDYQGEQDGGMSDGSMDAWLIDFEDDARLLGFNLDWAIIKDVLSLTSEISYMDVNQKISALEATDELTRYQPINTDEITVELGLTYRLAPTEELKLNYSYLRYENDDWQYFNLDPATFSFTNQAFNDVGHGIKLAYSTYF